MFAGKFSEDWKIARVAPIFKTGARDDRSNCRPIAVLPFRLFEKLIFMNTWSQINHYEHQSGFSTLTLCRHCPHGSINDWYLNIDQGNALV